MFKRFLLFTFFASAIGSAVAAVPIDVNAANEAALRSLKGIGPVKARAIVEERAAHGPFKDAADLAARVKGLAGPTLERLRNEGLAIGDFPVLAPTDAAHVAPRASARTAALAMRP
ncbi:helix-hairpin-helix domain-containing protein [Trinickia caryophylli]|uniref:Competence protein ComEA n=1 Tax=Trinickia caryophylli TaxID=28094 RepID=A0A1X7DX54_TRICW|nr:helix-hairpin-helix domain-containing protein [Trinickia caryophylli]PMS14242.1 competence protein ComE [Trinickia caryophylli]TRX17941.1 helix-hairpin-helix domain-containing protein [Trinickia caryophylli]WQE11284.1 helix-hairpin-helix domain-containing protein [Trinickia caryophylli]SMF22805.1 competence protein ComEA [Trinickia caryophylli]GLU32433.1 competence protein ComE [Trinickia caryophylli]